MLLELFSFAVVLAMLIPVLSPAADSPAPAQLTLAQTAAPQPGNVLTLDEALQIALENHPSIRASKERIDTQQAVVGQQMAAYYPLVNMTNGFQSGSQTGNTTGVANTSFETYLVRAGVNMSGMLGRLLREFSVTICVAILVSGFISLTLTPMLCSRYLRPPSHEKHGWLYRFLGRCLDAMNSGYETTLRWVMKHHVTTMVASAVVLIATIHMFGLVPKGFIPSEDTGQILINTEGAQGVSYEQMVQYQQQLAAIVAQDPNVESFFSAIGSGGISLAGNTGRIFMKLKPRSERTLSADELIRDLRPKLIKVPGIRVSLQNPPVIRVGGRLTRSLYQFTLQSPDAQELYRSAAIFEERLRALPDFRDVGSDLQLKNPQLQVVIDRDKMATMGITAQGISPRQVEEAFWNAYATRQVSTINTPNNQYQVIVEIDPKFQNDPSALAMLNIRSTANQAATAQPMVPLGSLASLKYTVGPLSVNHSGQLPSVTMSFNLREGVALGDAVETINKLARETLPATISTSFQGTAQEFQSSIKSLWVLLALAVFVVYLVLGILYESFIHPLTILSGLPSAGLGALIALYWFGMDLSIYAFVGLIMLIGIVKKNAIMMIDFALEGQRNEGKTPAQAIYEGALVRFRPIMMTTMAAIVVMVIGRNRNMHAWNTASTGLSPSLRSASRAKSIIMMAFFLTMPINRMMPIRAMTLKSLRKMISASSAPTPAEGSVERIVIGWIKLS